MPETANIVRHAYTGARQLFPAGIQWTAQARDGRSQGGGQQALFFNITGPSQILTIRFFDNLFDQYTIIGSAKGYDDSAWYPVHVTDRAPVDLHLMLLSKEAT